MAISTGGIGWAYSVEEEEEQKQKQLADESILIPANKTPKKCAVSVQFFLKNRQKIQRLLYLYSSVNY